MLEIDFDKLKEKMQKYQKKEKWGIRGIWLCFGLLELGGAYVIMEAFPSAQGVIYFLVSTVLIVAAMLIIPLVVADRLNAPFSKELQELVCVFQEDKDAQGFYDNLQNMKHSPRNMRAEMVWYINISTALYELGRKEQALILLKQLEEAAVGKKMDIIRKQKEYIENN